MCKVLVMSVGLMVCPHFCEASETDLHAENAQEALASPAMQTHQQNSGQFKGIDPRKLIDKGKQFAIGAFGVRSVGWGIYGMYNILASMLRRDPAQFKRGLLLIHKAIDDSNKVAQVQAVQDQARIVAATQQQILALIHKNQWSGDASQEQIDLLNYRLRYVCNEMTQMQTLVGEQRQFLQQRIAEVERIEQENHQYYEGIFEAFRQSQERARASIVRAE